MCWVFQKQSSHPESGKVFEDQSFNVGIETTTTPRSVGLEWWPEPLGICRVFNYSSPVLIWNIFRVTRSQSSNWTISSKNVSFDMNVCRFRYQNLLNIVAFFSCVFCDTTSAPFSIRPINFICWPKKIQT